MGEWITDIGNIIPEFLRLFEPYIPIIQIIILIIVVFVIFSVILRSIKRNLMKKVKTKKQMSNVTVFIGLLRFVFLLLLLILVLSTYYDSWGEFGFIAGLLTVALGWALQKPISGVVAWLIIVTRQPFRIRDRVIILGVKGDISNITLTHIFLDEVGGTIDGEESSGRTVMIPTSIIFEQEVINYTEQDDYILDEVTAMVTYESNLQKAEAIMMIAVEKVMKVFWEKFPKKVSRNTHTRLSFQPSGINVTVRYTTLAMKRNQIATDIQRVIHKQIIAEKDVEFAYPHTEVLLRNK